jgi:WD repeat-containing protein 81
MKRKNASSPGDSTAGAFSKNISNVSLIDKKYWVPYKMNHISFLQNMKDVDEASSGYPDLLLWRQKLSSSRLASKDIAGDIFSVGCLLAELHLCRPLFDSISLKMYLEDGTLPGFLQELPPHVRILVEACIQTDWTRY